MLRNGSRITLASWNSTIFNYRQGGAGLFRRVARTKKTSKAIYFRQAAGTNSMDTLSMFRAGIFGLDRGAPELTKIPPRPFSPDLKSTAGFLTMAVLSQTLRRGEGEWKRIQLKPPRIFAGINYFRGRKDPGRYHTGATTILTATRSRSPSRLLRFHVSIQPSPPTTRLVFFQPDFSVSLRTGMQFTELFLNPSGGTTAEKEESAAEKKETRAERRRKRRRR